MNDTKPLPLWLGFAVGFVYMCLLLLVGFIGAYLTGNYDKIAGGITIAAVGGVSWVGGYFFYKAMSLSATRLSK